MEASVEFEATTTNGRALSLSGKWLYQMARWCRQRSAVHQSNDLARTTDETAYRNWRSRELSGQLADHFDRSTLAGKDVLDFGCGTGELSGILADLNPQSVVGLDISRDAVNRARADWRSRNQTTQCTPEFVWNEKGGEIPLADESVDLICCFDVVEHIPDMAAIADSWHRVLRPGGKIWIWWSPWRGPFGHHLESLVPIPWMHLFFSEATIFSAAANLYDDPDYIPRKWDMDPSTGLKKPNKWRSTSSFFPFLNGLTGRAFEGHLRKAGLTTSRREQHGFSGSGIRRSTRILQPLPVIGECFTSYYVYELTKPV